MTIFSLQFAKAAGERAISTFAEVFIGLYGTDQLGWLSVDVWQTAAVSGIAAGLSVLKSIVVANTTGGVSVGRHEAVTVAGESDER